MIEAVGKIWRRVKEGAATIGGVLALALAIGGLSTVCRAAEPLGSARPGGVPDVLASVTILSDAAMAKEKGAGLQLPQILNDPTGRQRVLLWDELRTPPQQLAPSNDPTISTGK
jgi:hypothetical protein